MKNFSLRVAEYFLLLTILLVCGAAHAQGPTYSSKAQCWAGYDKNDAGYDATYMDGHKPLAAGESKHPYEADACVFMDTVAGKKWVIQRAGQPKADYVKNQKGIVRRFDCGNKIYEVVLSSGVKTQGVTASIEGACSTCTTASSEMVVTAVPSDSVAAVPQGVSQGVMPQSGVVVSNNSYWGGGYGGGYSYIPGGGGYAQAPPKPGTVPQGPPPVTPPRPGTFPVVPPPVSGGGGGGSVPPPISPPVYGGGGNPPIVNPPINWGGGGNSPPSVNPPINWGGGNGNINPPGVSPPINWGGTNGGGNGSGPTFGTRAANSYNNSYGAVVVSPPQYQNGGSYYVPAPNYAGNNSSPVPGAPRFGTR